MLKGPLASLERHDRPAFEGRSGSERSTEPGSSAKTVASQPVVGYRIRSRTAKKEILVYVISGSNMAGKSTFLRAVGSNAVLAMAGAPVTAKKLRLSPFKVCASISIADSLLEGKSKFLVEVERLRDAIACTKESRPVLFLIDEILGGTNSRDRRVAAEAVVRTLVEGGALGALSTHDLALTEITDSVGGGANVHMSSRRGTDVLDFDYLLKPGITPEANATAIARLSGVPV